MLNENGNHKCTNLNLLNLLNVKYSWKYNWFNRTLDIDGPFWLMWGVCEGVRAVFSHVKIVNLPVLLMSSLTF